MAPSLKGFPRGIPLDTSRSTVEPFASDQSGRRGADPIAVAACRSTADIQAVIRWATESRVPLVPVSSAGGVRRRGDTICPRPSVIVDLSGMKRVIHVDGRDAIAIVEPGVTFGELDAALKPHGLRSFRPLLARREKSVLAAFLEREPMTVPGQHWDSADPLSSFELVFGSGDIFRTGGAALPGTLEENLARGNRQMLSTGPMHTDFGRVIQGAQGALGIVSWSSIYCQRIPAVETPLFASSPSLDAVVELAYRMLRRRPAGQLFILNAAQLALLAAPSREAFSALRAQLPPWILYLELSAPEHFAEEAMAYRRADLERDAGSLSVAISEALGSVAASAIGRTPHPAPDRLGIAHQEVFFLSQLDRVGQHLAALPAADAADAAVYLQPLAHGVNAHCQFTLLAGPEERATIAGRAVRSATQLAASGGFFSRPYFPWAHVPFEQDRAIAPFLARTKRLFDPHGVLQPASQSLGESL